MMKKNEGTAGSNQTFDSLFRLLPSLIAAYPAFMNLLEEEGAQGDLSKIIGALPEMIEKLKETDDESLQNLLDHLTEVMPELEEILPQKEG